SCLPGVASRYSMLVGAQSRDRSGAALRLVPQDAATPRPVLRTGLLDQEIIAAVQSGDVRVASALCDRVWPQVDRTIRRLLGASDADRDDIAQLALIEIVGTIGRYRGDCSLDSWAQTVASH